MFVDMKLYEHESKPDDVGAADTRRREPDEESLEMESLVGSDSEQEEDEKKLKSPTEGANGSLTAHAGLERLRSRSPHRRIPTDG